MIYILYQRQNTEELPQAFNGPGEQVIEAGGEFQPTALFTSFADKTLFGIFGNDDFDKIDAKYNPIQYTPQGAVDKLNGIYGNYFTLAEDNFTIIDGRPEDI